MEAYWRRSPSEREWHEKRYVERKGRCPHCQRPRSECSDPEKDWYADRTICYASMSADSARRRYTRLHEDRQWHNGLGTNWAEKPSDEHPFHRDAGVHIGVVDSDHKPWDRFLSVENQSFNEPEPDPDDDGQPVSDA